MVEMADEQETQLTRPFEVLIYSCDICSSIGLRERELQLPLASPAETAFGQITRHIRGSKSREEVSDVQYSVVVKCCNSSNRYVGTLQRLTKNVLAESAAGRVVLEASCSSSYRDTASAT